MKPLTSRAVTVVLSAVLVVVGLELTAYAANGHAFLLGQANSESRPASLTNAGRGPALSIHTSKKSAPLTVDSSKRVEKLNADLVDGLSAADLQTRAITWTLPADNVANAYVLAGLREGTYFATVSALLDSDVTAACNLFENATELLVYGANRMGTYSMVSGGNIFNYGGGVLTLTCDGDLDPTIENTVTLIRLSHVVHKTAQDAPPGVRARLQLPSRP